MLVAILTLQLYKCLRVPCGLCLDTILRPIPCDGILLCLALLNDVECPVTIYLVSLVAPVGKEHGYDSVNHYQIELWQLRNRKNSRHDGRPIIYDNVEKLKVENLAIPFRTLNIGRFSDGGGESSRKSSNFVAEIYLIWTTFIMTI